MVLLVLKTPLVKSRSGKTEVIHHGDADVDGAVVIGPRAGKNLNLSSTLPTGGVLGKLRPSLNQQTLLRGRNHCLLGGESLESQTC